MSIRFACPVCKTSYTVDDADAGKKSDCKKCGQRLQVPVPPTSRSRTVLGEVMPPPNKPFEVKSPIQKSPPPREEKSSRAIMPSYLSTPLVKKRKRIHPALVVLGLSILAVCIGMTVLIIGIKKQKEHELAFKKEISKIKGPTSSTEGESSSQLTDENANFEPLNSAQEHLPILTGEQAYKKLVSSCVFISSRRGSGTGFLVDSSRKLIVTNYHVVGEEDDVVVIYPQYDKNGELISDASKYGNSSKKIAIKAKVLSLQPSKDLALIQVEKIDPKAIAIKFAPRPAPTGSTLYSVGGSGIGENLLWRLTKGIVRGRFQRQQQADFGVIDCMILESDAPVNRGDSGGPVVNDQGLLVAVTAHYFVEQRQVSGNIDVEEVRKFLAKHAGEK